MKSGSKIGLAVSATLLVFIPLHATTMSSKHKEMLKQLDELDRMDFASLNTRANECIDVHDFSCAELKIGEAAAYDKDPRDKKSLAATKQRLTEQSQRDYYDKHPEAVSAIADAKTRLLYTGPSALRIIDILELIKIKKKDPVIIAQINATGGPYKIFTTDDFTLLEKMRISDEVVTAMITITTEYNKEQKRIAQQKAEKFQQEQLVVRYQAQQPQHATVVTHQGGKGLLETTADCMGLSAALEACSKAGGFFTMGCEAVARSQFDCPGM